MPRRCRERASNAQSYARVGHFNAGRCDRSVGPVVFLVLVASLTETQEFQTQVIFNRRTTSPYKYIRNKYRRHSEAGPQSKLEGNYRHTAATKRCVASCGRIDGSVHLMRACGDGFETILFATQLPHAPMPPGWGPESRGHGESYAHVHNRNMHREERAVNRQHKAKVPKTWEARALSCLV